MAAKKKLSNELKISMVAAVLGAITLILFAVLSRDGENASSGLLTYMTLAAGIILQVLSVALYAKLVKCPVLLSALRFLQTICYVVSLSAMLLDRINWLFRIMSKMAAAPLTALFPIVIVAFVLTILVHVIATYFSYEK